jgi:amino acid transporter
VRPRLAGFRVTAPGALALEREPEPATPIGRAWRAAKRLLIGVPIATARQGHERLPKVMALAVFSSDALSSVAFATEASLFGLMAGGPTALPYVLPISIAITLLLAVVATSYRQTVFAYPNGGGSYIVAKENLSANAGLVAGGALLIDYVLTVAVGVAAGVSAITSAFPELRPYQVPLCLATIVTITVLNLRGVRESGTIFAIPTYLFVGAMLLLIAVGVTRLALGTLEPVTPHPEAAAALALGTAPITIFLILNAFAQGCSALTGVEAVSNGVPAFKPPESRNAAITLVWMAVLLGVMFVGATVLAVALEVVPYHGETVMSMIGTAVFGRGLLYQYLQWATFLILALAANTAYADFPRLASIMARDGYFPRQFSFRGDRLAFTNGIIALGLLAAGVVVIYGGHEQAMIPLFALGVFLSFTLSQAGMVAHWWRERGLNWRRSMLINGLGTTATAVVLVVIVGSKFTHGAWIIVLLIPTLVVLFRLIRGHYREVADQLVATDAELAGEPTLDAARIDHTILIPVAEVNQPALAAVAYARSLTGQPTGPTTADGVRIIAVHVTDTPADRTRLQQRWERVSPGVPLVVIDSPYRSLVGPLLVYVDRFRREAAPGRVAIVTVLLPEFVPAHWWEHLLHTQTGLRLKGALLFRPGTAVLSVPHHLRG